MTDDRLPAHDSSGDLPARIGADPHIDAEIAALLASLDASAPPAMPAGFAARLDAVIADEASARRSAPAHHLRKIVVAWGVAAAAVVAVVAGVSVVADNVGIGGGSSSDSQVTSDSKALSAPESGSRATERPVVHADRLADDARPLLSLPSAGRVAVPDDLTDLGCPAPREPRPDRLVLPVTYAGSAGDTPAILVLTTRPPRTATVFACDGTRLQQVALD